MFYRTFKNAVKTLFVVE